MRDVVLYELSVERNPERVADFQLQTGSSVLNLSRPLFVGQVMEVSLGLVISVPNQDDPAWTMAFKLNGVFEIDEGTDPDLVDQFVSSTVTPALWPYARELVLSMTTRMRVPPIVLQMLDLRNVPLVLQPDAEPDISEEPANKDAEAD